VQQSLLFGTNSTVDVVLSDVANRPHKTIPNAEPGKPATLLHIFSSKEDIAGEVKINVFGGKKLDHAGIRIELKGAVGASWGRTRWRRIAHGGDAGFVRPTPRPRGP
jgi:hypothetical protein